MCKHSVIYQIENEANGGNGCMLCNLENSRQRRGIAANLPEISTQPVRPGMLVENTTAPVLDASSGCCERGICADCGIECSTFTAAISPDDAEMQEWRDMGIETRAPQLTPEHRARIIGAFEARTYSFSGCPATSWEQRH